MPRVRKVLAHPCDSAKRAAMLHHRRLSVCVRESYERVEIAGQAREIRLRGGEKMIVSQTNRIPRHSVSLRWNERGKFLEVRALRVGMSGVSGARAHRSGE